MPISASRFNGVLKHPSKAKVSVLDSGFALRDGVWEGFRMGGGHDASLVAHLDRLYEGAKALMLDPGISRKQLIDHLYAALDAIGEVRCAGQASTPPEVSSRRSNPRRSRAVQSGRCPARSTCMLPGCRSPAWSGFALVTADAV